MQHLNLMHAHAQPNLHAMNIMPPYNQLMPLYACNSTPIQPMHMYTQPMYNHPLGGQLYNQGHQNMSAYGVMPTNNSYDIPPGFNFMPQRQPLNPSEFHVEHNSENIIEDKKQETPVNKHVYLNGMLYNTDYLGPEPEDSNENPTKDTLLDDQDENYDPSSDPTPTIHGLRFYNPFYGPEGAIPKQNGSKLAMHRLSHADFYGAQAQSVAREILHKNQLLKNQQAKEGKQQQELDKKVDTVVHNFRVKSKQRRQGRNRFRGFTQSFGIVAPVKRVTQIPNGNVEAAKNVLSLFDKKHPYKRIPLDEMETDNNDECSQSTTDQNNNDTFFKD
ncbi:uncharacterized protein LOC117791324 isoform X2 [Drosophila innubila]|uniref:uncharacterized protein LOC117791324 isoform X2 n=1 Tax=Drosophila innubila TaxID=198719 RepID=UPI00148DDD9B|nr:uncharacterized protein LOC117791324 isoform X2 [Drosophila innubila]